jgi:hypothetical protein
MRGLSSDAIEDTANAAEKMTVNAKDSQDLLILVVSNGGSVGSLCSTVEVGVNSLQLRPSYQTKHG